MYCRLRVCKNIIQFMSTENFKRVFLRITFLSWAETVLAQIFTDRFKNLIVHSKSLSAHTHVEFFRDCLYFLIYKQFCADFLGQIWNFVFTGL